MKLTIGKLRRLINEEVSSIKRSSKSDARKRQALRENRRVSEIMRLFEMKEEDITDPAVKADIDKLIDALNAGKLDGVVAALNAPGLKSAQGHAFLESGDLDKDKVSVSPDKANQACNKMRPTQSQIFCQKSTAFPLTAWSTVTAGAKGKFHGGISVAGTGGEYLILDGHHRWSGAMALSNAAAFKATVYEFPGLSQEEILSRLQVGVATQREEGADLPSAGGGDEDALDKKDEKTGSSGGDPDDILGRDKAFISARISELTGDQSTEKNLLKMSDGVFLGDGYFEAMKETPTPKALALVGLTLDDVIEKDPQGVVKDKFLPVAQCKGNGMACPVRAKIIDKIADNLSKLPSAEGAPKRSIMPQLDHKEIGEDAGKKAIEDGFGAGSINHEEPYFETNESIDLRRWNKLAGILKD